MKKHMHTEKQNARRMNIYSWRSARFRFHSRREPSQRCSMYDISMYLNGQKQNQRKNTVKCKAARRRPSRCPLVFFFSGDSERSSTNASFPPATFVEKYCPMLVGSLYKILSSRVYMYTYNIIHKCRQQPSIMFEKI